MARNVIALKGCPEVSEEFAAGEALIPGHWILLNSSSQWVKNTANADDVALTLALERDELGADINEAYASGEVVKAGTFKPGDRAYVWLASGQNVAVGDHLTGNNAGLFTKTGVADGVRVARAVEAVDTSGSAPVAGTRIRVEIV